MLALAGAWSLAAAPGPTTAATIEGSIRVVLPVSRRPSAITMYPRRGLEGRHGSAGQERDAGFNCIAYLEGVTPPPAPAVPDTFSMRQAGERFDPHVLPVRVGSVVRFPNLDPFFHNVFSYSKPKRFDLGKYPMGRSRSVRFSTPGLIQVFCEIHEFMSAYILVLPHPYFATPAADGHFEIDGVPPGRYRLVVWRPGGATTTHPLTVPTNEQTVHADIEI